jgi:hypothetical protein
LRIAVALALPLCFAAGCAPHKQDPNAETSTYESRITTGSNIPRKGSAVIVDKSVIEDNLGRQSGTIPR